LEFHLQFHDYVESESINTAQYMETVATALFELLLTYFLLEEYYITWTHTIAVVDLFSCSPIEQEIAF